MNKQREILWVGLAGLCVTLPVALYISSEVESHMSLFVTVPLSIAISFGLFPVLWGTNKNEGLFRAQDENSRDALCGLAQSYMIQKNYLEAAKIYRQVMDLYPQDILSYRSFLDVVVGNLGQTEIAEKEFRKAIQKVSDKEIQKKLFKVYHECTTEKEIELL